MKRPHLSLPSILLVVSPVLAQLPYNPSRTIVTNNGSLAYTFSQSSFIVYNITDKLNASSVGRTISSPLPFLANSSSRAYIPIADGDGITVLAGDCSQAGEGLGLWRFAPDDSNNGTWSSLQLTLGDSSLSANYLSAGFFFSADGTTADGSTYIFGGMCPTSNATTTDWTSDATYSNTMLTLSADALSSSGGHAGAPYQLSITGERAPPIAEAGLSITPLLPTYSNPSSTNGSQQQNLVLIGGHTSSAFINMSQVALYSLPQQSWAFLGIDQPTGSSNGELLIRDTVQIEPRSGHTAVLTEDGSQIIVFGGWVGDVSTPATPQLAVLQVGQGYGGTGDWAWKTVNQVSSPLQTDQGIYGHSAAMLPGGVMMVQGGYTIGGSSSKVKRQSESSTLLLFNATSSTWISTYTNPGLSPASTSTAGTGEHGASKGKSSNAAGLGAGIGFAIAAILGILFAWYVYAQRKRQERERREKELRDLALGTDGVRSPSVVNTGVEGRAGIAPSGVRTASWGGRQEQSIGLDVNAFPWAPVVSEEAGSRLRSGNDHEDDNAFRQAERTGLLMEIPSPTRGLRRNLPSRGGYAGSGPAGPVFRIDEEEEGSSHNGSLHLSKTPGRAGATTSDPFKDPLPPLNARSGPEEGRKKELQTWVDDWQSAAESMNLSRNPSQAHSRTYSNLSQNHTSHSNSGRGSPEKSDRTGSNLSEKSMTSSFSITHYMEPSSTVSRNTSQRSASAGYALFSNAAAAVGRIAGTRDYDTSRLDRSSSRRSVSQPYKQRTASMTSQTPQALPGEIQNLLSTTIVPASTNNPDFHTPAELPVRQRDPYYARTSSLTNSGRKALGMLGSVRRVFTGTGSVDVSQKVAILETKTPPTSSPTKSVPEMTEVSPTKAAEFWKSKRGAKDWDDLEEEMMNPSSSVRRKPLPSTREADERDEEDWDPERAVQNRVVQVMFTVPKEKLRVVNADALSLISRSDVDENEVVVDREVKRMSSVRELDENERYSPVKGLGETESYRGPQENSGNWIAQGMRKGKGRNL